MRREIVGGAAGRRRNQHAVADEFVHPDLAVHGDLELGGLIDLAEQRNFVDGERFMGCLAPVVRRHAQRVDDGGLGSFQPLHELHLVVVVEEEANRAPVHAVDRNAAIEVTVHGLQHHPVAAERHDDIGLCRRRVAVALGERPKRLLRLFGLAGNEGDFGEAGHDLVRGAWSADWKRAL